VRRCSDSTKKKEKKKKKLEKKEKRDGLAGPAKLD
jgi:hypothetical protein